MGEELIRRMLSHAESFTLGELVVNDPKSGSVSLLVKALQYNQ